MSSFHLNPLVLIFAGFFSLFLAVIIFFRQRRRVEAAPSSDLTIQLPTKWDDGEITRLLQSHHDKPEVLAHAVTSIKSRMILNQDLKTAQQRLKLVASVIEVFKLNKEMQGLLHDIHLADKDFEIRKVETDMRKEDTDSRLESERQLRDLRKQRDELQLKKEISQLTQDIKTAETPSAAEGKLTPEQQRRLKRMDIEDKLRELDRVEEEALKTARSDADRVRIQNMHADKREELREQLSKYLV